MGSLLTRREAGVFDETPAEEDDLFYLDSSGMKICFTVPLITEVSSISASGTLSSSTDRKTPPAPLM